MEADSWKIFSDSNTVLKADKNGLEVKGVIRATSGEIGGFDILSDYLSYNNQEWTGTNKKGIYIGQKGIKLGNNFKVDSEGNLTAASGTFTGSVNAGSIRYGKDKNTGENYGKFSGSGLTDRTVPGGAIKESTLTTANMIAGINASLSYADFANGVFNGWNKSGYVKTDVLVADGATIKDSLTFKGYDVRWTSITDASGSNYMVLSRSTE